MRLGELLREAFTCPKCGKSIVVMATGWRGRGTGQHGSADYAATGHEQVSPETHCMCPGGPCDLAGVLPREGGRE